MTHQQRIITEDDIFSLLKQNEEENILLEKLRNFRNESYNPYPNGWNRLDFYKDVFSDNYIDGYLMTYSHGTVIRQPQRSYQYRGENEIFKSSKATLYRKLDQIEDKEKALVEEFVAYMRIADFLWLLLQLDHTQQFTTLQLRYNNTKYAHIDLLYEQLAQHYGLDTKWLDITSDLEVALFFACCKYDNNVQKWEPLTNTDFSKSMYAKFGVLIRRSTNHPDNLNLSESPFLEILPVGYQPFMRCHMQNSFVAKMNQSSCLQDDNSFEMLHFKHNEKFCSYIYEKMEGGKKIYPYEGLTILNDEIKDIKNRSIFTLETLDFALEEQQFESVNREQMIHLLINHGYRIISETNFISKEKIQLVNKHYMDFDIEKTYGIKLSSRFCYIP